MTDAIAQNGKSKAPTARAFGDEAIGKFRDLNGETTGVALSRTCDDVAANDFDRDSVLPAIRALEPRNGFDLHLTSLLLDVILLLGLHLIHPFVLWFALRERWVAPALPLIL
mgnify:CR=1 FL=1